MADTTTTPTKPQTNPLQASQIEVLRLLAAGYTARQIARLLGLTNTAITMRVHRARAVLGTETTAHTVLVAHIKGYLAVPR